MKAHFTISEFEVTLFNTGLFTVTVEDLNIGNGLNGRV
jgi:hypothetical protein